MGGSQAGGPKPPSKTVSLNRNKKGWGRVSAGKGPWVQSPVPKKSDPGEIHPGIRGKENLWVDAGAEGGSLWGRAEAGAACTRDGSGRQVEGKGRATGVKGPLSSPHPSPSSSPMAPDGSGGTSVTPPHDSCAHLGAARGSHRAARDVRWCPWTLCIFIGDLSVRLRLGRAACTSEGSPHPAWVSAPQDIVLPFVLNPRCIPGPWAMAGIRVPASAEEAPGACKRLHPARGRPRGWGDWHLLSRLLHKPLLIPEHLQP